MLLAGLFRRILVCIFVNKSLMDISFIHQEGNKSEFVNKCMKKQLAVVPKSEAKLAIEQLLMQESFSRCCELMIS